MRMIQSCPHYFSDCPLGPLVTHSSQPADLLTPGLSPPLGLVTGRSLCLGHFFSRYLCGDPLPSLVSLLEYHLLGEPYLTMLLTTVKSHTIFNTYSSIFVFS